MPKGCIIAAAVAAGLFILVVGGCLALGFFGLGKMKGMAKDALNENVVIQEHIGEVQSVELDLAASGANQNSQAMVMQVTGSKDSGSVSLVMAPSADGQKIEIGEGSSLTLSSGETYNLGTGEAQ